MKRKLVLSIGLLTVSAILVFVSISEVKANGEQGGDGNLHFVLTVCVCPHGEVYDYSNDCDAGANHCVPGGSWAAPPCMKDGAARNIKSE